MRKRRKYLASIAVIVTIAAFFAFFRIMDFETSVFGNVLFPVQKFVSGIEYDMVDIIETYKDSEALKNENEALRAELNEARQTMAKLYSYEEENAVLRDKLAIHDAAPELELMEANIVTTLSGLQLDRGRDDGVGEYMAVVTTDGLLGIIGYCGDNWSNIMEICSENFVCGGCNPRTHEKGIIESRGGKVCLTCLMSGTQTAVGDLIVTEDGKIPGGLIVGKVSRIIEEENGLSKYAEIENTVDINDINRAYIITGTKDEIM